MDLLSSKVQLAKAKSQNTSSNLLSDSLLSTSLALAESNARLAKTESLLAEVLPVRRQLESSKVVKEESEKYTRELLRLEGFLFENQQRLEQYKAELKQLMHGVDQH